VALVAVVFVLFVLSWWKEKFCQANWQDKTLKSLPPYSPTHNLRLADKSGEWLELITTHYYASCFNGGNKSGSCFKLGIVRDSALPTQRTGFTTHYSLS
jgi:hypothetical protein